MITQSALSPCNWESDLNSSPPPPPYISSSKLLKLEKAAHEADLNILREVDIVIVVDDSASMLPYWEDTRNALSIVAEQAAKYDPDGIDVCFLNNKVVGRNLKENREVMSIFGRVQPRGQTPLGATLQTILSSYISKLKAKQSFRKIFNFGISEAMKPLNILILTDGEPTDNPEVVIAKAAKTLDQLDKPRNQVGLQFVQIGSLEDAARYLEHLDDNLSQKYGVRDMVDTVPTKGGETLSGEKLLKILLGGISKRFDEKKI